MKDKIVIYIKLIIGITLIYISMQFFRQQEYIFSVIAISPVEWLTRPFLKRKKNK